MATKNRKAVLIEEIKGATNYGDYKIIVGNRPIDQSTVRDLIESFETFGSASVSLTILETKVITGKKERFIADGNHRIFALRHLNLPFDAKVVRLEVDTYDNIIRYVSTLNNSQKRWSTINYLDAFQFIDEYQQLLQLKKESNITITDLMFIFIGDGSRKALSKFKKGDVTFPDFDKSFSLYKEVIELKPLLPNKAFSRRALYRIMNIASDYKRMSDAIKKASENYTIFSENETQLGLQLEKIYQREFKVIATAEVTKTKIRNKNHIKAKSNQLELIE
jgi:hypothetical protein